MLLAEDVLQRLTKIIDFNYDIGNIKTIMGQFSRQKFKIFIMN